MLAASDARYLGWFGWQHVIVRKDPLIALAS